MVPINRYISVGCAGHLEIGLLLFRALWLVRGVIFRWFDDVPMLHLVALAEAH